MAAAKEELPGRKNRCRCKVCVLAFERTEGAYREIVVYGLPAPFINQMRLIADSAMV